MDHLIAVVIMALTAQGVFTSMGEGMILEPLKNFLSKFIGEPLAHSFYSCPRCMCSVYGSVALASLQISGMDVNWWLWPVYVLCAVGLQELMDR